MYPWFLQERVNRLCIGRLYSSQPALSKTLLSIISAVLADGLLYQSISGFSVVSPGSKAVAVSDAITPLGSVLAIISAESTAESHICFLTFGFHLLF